MVSIVNAITTIVLIIIGYPVQEMVNVNAINANANPVGQVWIFKISLYLNFMVFIFFDFDNLLGVACQCPLSTESCRSANGKICNGHGQCICGQCRCNTTETHRYSGAKCESCPVLIHLYDD